MTTKFFYGLAIAATVAGVATLAAQGPAAPAQGAPAQGAPAPAAPAQGGRGGGAPFVPLENPRQGLPASVEKRPVPPPGAGPKAPITAPSPAAPVAPGDISLTPAVTPWTGPRTPDGQPDVQGSYGKNWVGAQGPNFDIEEGPDAETNPNKPPAPQMVRTPDGRIPYLPWAREQRNQHRLNFFNPTEMWHIDSNAKCLPMGHPHQTLDQGFWIVQTKDLILFNFNYNQHVRQVYLDGRPPLKDSVKLWYGDAIGRWEGNSLLITSNNHNEAAWYDAYGNFHSPDLKLQERYVFVGNRVYYDVISTDPRVFTRPWTAHNEFQKAANEPQEPWEVACFEGERNAEDKQVAPVKK